MKKLIAKCLLAFPNAQPFFMKLATYPTFYQWTKNNQHLELIDGSAREKRNKLFSFVAQKLNLQDSPISYYEFGVHKGLSIKWWFSNNRNQKSRFYGYDSFEGLPEDWIDGRGTGKFSTDGKIPDSEDERVKFHKGWFNTTLHKTLALFNTNNRKIIHLDADLYRSTIYPLMLIGHTLKAGDVLIFDEFLDTIHEFRAFEDFQVIFNIKYKVIAATNHYAQVAVEIL